MTYLRTIAFTTVFILALIVAVCVAVTGSLVTKVCRKLAGR